MNVFSEDDDSFELECPESPWDESKERLYQMRRGAPLLNPWSPIRCSVYK
jgi:hypothetical protein